MRDCKKIHDLLSLHLEGALSQGEQKLVEKHLAVCITARREMEQLGRMRQSLRSLPEPELPSDLHEKIMSRLGMQTTPVRKISWGRTPLFLAAAMVTVFFFFNRDSGWKESVFRSGEVKYAPSQAPSNEREQATAASNSQSTRDRRDKDAKLDGPSPAEVKGGFDGLTRAKPAQPEPALAQKKSRAPGKDAAAGARSSEPKLSLTYDAASEDKNLEETSKPSGDLGIVSKSAKPGDLEDSSILIKSYSNETTTSGLPPMPAESADSFAAAPPAAPSAAAPSMQKEKPPVAAKPAPALSVKAPAAAKSKSREETEPSIPLPAGASSFPAKVEFKLPSSWSGNGRPGKYDQNALITDQVTFSNYWKIFHPDAEPQLNFENEAVVYLYDGEKPTGGYSIRVTRLEEKERALAVHYKTEIPPAGAITTQAFTYPSVLQVIPKPTKPVTFIKDP